MEVPANIKNVDFKDRGAIVQQWLYCEGPTRDFLSEFLCFTGHISSRRWVTVNGKESTYIECTHITTKPQWSAMPRQLLQQKGHSEDSHIISEPNARRATSMSQWQLELCTSCCISSAGSVLLILDTYMPFLRVVWVFKRPLGQSTGCWPVNAQANLAVTGAHNCRSVP